MTFTWRSAATAASCAAKISAAITGDSAVRGNVRQYSFRLWVPRATLRGHWITAYGQLSEVGDTTIVRVRFVPEPLQLVGVVMIAIVLLLLILAHAWVLAIALALFSLVGAVLFVQSANRERTLISDFIQRTCEAGAVQR